MKKRQGTRSYINFSHSILVLLPGRKIHQRQKEWASVCGGACVSACDRDLEKERGVGIYEYSFESPDRLNLDLAKKKKEEAVNEEIFETRKEIVRLGKKIPPMNRQRWIGFIFLCFAISRTSPSGCHTPSPPPPPPSSFESFG